MKTYTQRTLPIVAGKLLFFCPVCKTKYRIRVKTGNGAIYFHNAEFTCVVKT